VRALAARTGQEGTRAKIRPGALAEPPPSVRTQEAVSPSRWRTDLRVVLAGPDARQHDVGTRARPSALCRRPA
ncbi:MAG TPA: hypothetical protein VI542_09065, partial [Candidatus Tectomicrobia bacterium]